MSTQDLQHWLINNDGFKAQLNALIIDSVQNQFKNLSPSCLLIRDHDWNYLLFCASLLAQSNSGHCQDAALRIAQATLENKNLDESKKAAAVVILDSLANNPAIKLAEQRNLISTNEILEKLPTQFIRDLVKRSFDHSITLADFSSLSVNRFQKSFWEKARNNDWVSVSAPTSAGKSFIVSQWLADCLKTQDNLLIIYIVPTRALIQQVQQDVELILKSERILNASVSTIPLKSSFVDNSSNIFIFTQERLHIFLNAFDWKLKCDLLVVDEAHKIGDETRGVLLQQAIEATLHLNPNCKMLFASPMTENPEIFLQDSPTKIKKAPLSSENVTVNQNLIWVSQRRGKPKKWAVSLVIENDPTCIGEIDLTSSPSPISKRLPFIAYALGNPLGGNVIYVNGAADAEKTAKQIFDLTRKNNEISNSEIDQEILELTDLIKKTIHSKYSLWKFLHQGIAFHYGNMPLIVRTEVERLFAKNKIRYLVCTSTLIEGINMPCQSIFVRGPTKGKGKPMPLNDFWNLAGRAGRWGKEFQGNVICIDPEQTNVWKEGPPKRRTRYQITRTTDAILNNPENLIEFIENKTPRNVASQNPKLEYVYSYLFSSFIRNGSLTDSYWAKRFPPDHIAKLEGLLKENKETIITPSEIIIRNPSISPFAMDDILTYFHNRTFERLEPVEGLIPVPPESTDAVESYEKILHRINKHLGSKVFGWSNKRVWQVSLLIVNWMRGHSLAQLISTREKAYIEKGYSVDLPELIRSTMDDVETIARFQAPKYLSCYVDLLKHFLSSIDRHDLLDDIMELNVLLEFGVSQMTQLSLIGLGLSRSTAIALSELISDTSLNEEQCVAWLLSNEWMTEGMPELSKREVEKILERS